MSIAGKDESDMKLSEDAGTYDSDAIYDTDEEDTSVANDQPLSEASSIISNFDNHLSYKLESIEVDSLLKRKWKYTWKMPALDMSNCHWRGTGECFIKDLETKSYYGLKPKLHKHWLEIYMESCSSEFHQSKQRSFFSICSSYFDIMHYNKKPFYLKGLEEDSNIMDAYLMHSLNHIFKSRDLIVKNERKLAKNQESVESNSFDDDAYRDRGFTRPKVLILLPLASIMRRVVKRLIKLTPTKHKATVESLERFCEEFGSGTTESKDGDDDLEIPKPRSSGKPADFQALFGKHDDNDHFMIGIKYTNRGIMLYGDFYTSDMIIASPLGLITKIGEAEVEKEKDVDYLSSIEILIIDHADVMLMQNWSHVNTVVEQLNRLPSKQHGTDVMRLRPWYLDGQARFYRQTVILGSHTNPEMNALFNQHCLNYRGKVKLECTYKGVLPKILIQARQVCVLEDGRREREPLTLVARKPCFSLPTACPNCLPAYIYLKFANIPFNLEFNLIHPDSDQIPFVESGDYVAYNNENGGVLQKLKEDGIVDLDADVSGIPEWVSYKAMVESWLADAVLYELWVGSDGKSAHKIYYSDLPWPIGKILYYKQIYVVKQLLGITSENAERREEEIYRRATVAYGALSARLGEQSLFFEDRPTSLDAVFLGHALFTLLALPETSVLRSKLLVHANLVNYAETLKMEHIDASSSSSSVPQSDPSSSASKRGPSYWSSKPRTKPTREKTEEDKKFRRRAKYFLATQVVAVLLFLSILGGSNGAEVELGDDDDGFDYE